MLKVVDRNREHTAKIKRCVNKTSTDLYREIECTV